MSGRLINEIKHMYIHDDNSLKNISLNDNLYFTLRDIFWNTNTSDTCSQVSMYNSMLTNDISYEKRTNTFQYTNLLEQKDEVKNILNLLNRITEYWFEFDELEEDEQIYQEEYMKFDEWWKQFNKLRNILNEHYKQLTQN